MMDTQNTSREIDFDAEATRLADARSDVGIVDIGAEIADAVKAVLRISANLARWLPDPGVGE